MNEAFVIGIAGGSGSGKSTFARRLKDCFGNDISLVSCDNYYKAHDDMPFEERKSLNYDSPQAFEFDLMINQIKALKGGADVVSPIYDFSRHTRSKETTEIKARPIVIIDGILIFTEPKLRELMNLKIYVETDADERILRRARRDICERGRDFDNVIEQYLATVKPMHNKYVEPTKAYADIIINGGLNQNAFDIIKIKIENVLRRERNVAV